MNIINFVNDDCKTHFAPTYNYCFFETVVQNIDAQMLANTILEKEPEIIAEHEYVHDWNTGLGEKSLTSRSNFYNVLAWKEFIDIKIQIRKYHDIFLESIKLKSNENLYCQCWANVLRHNEKIKQHQHWTSKYCYLGGHICLTDCNTNTYYVNPITQNTYASKNEIGKLTIFPNWLPHYTDTYIENQQRITLAFDIITETVYREDIFFDKKSHWILI